MINILVCDDEKEWSEILFTLVKDYFDKKKISSSIYSYYGRTLHEQVIEAYSFDIAILDINLNSLDYNEMELAQKLKAKNEDIVIIFVTRYREYALESYKLNEFAYLFKPVTPSALNAKLTQAMIYLNGIRVSRGKLIKFGKTEIAERYIISIETEARNLRVWTIEGSVKTSYIPLSNVLNALSYQFILLNRSVIINTRYMVYHDNRVVKLKMKRIYDIPVRKRAKLSEQLEELCKR